MSINERTLQPGRPALLRLDSVEARLRRLIRVLTLIRVEQVRAELRQCSKMYSLVRMLYLSCVQQVVEDRSETAQSPESGVVKFHVGLPFFSRYGSCRTDLAHGFPCGRPMLAEGPVSHPKELFDVFTWEGRITSGQVQIAPALASEARTPKNYGLPGSAPPGSVYSGLTTLLRASAWCSWCTLAVNALFDIVKHQSGRRELRSSYPAIALHNESEKPDEHLTLIACTIGIKRTG